MTTMPRHLLWGFLGKALPLTMIMAAFGEPWDRQRVLRGIFVGSMAAVLILLRECLSLYRHRHNHPPDWLAEYPWRTLHIGGPADQVLNIVDEVLRTHALHSVNIERRYGAVVLRVSDKFLGVQSLAWLHIFVAPAGPDAAVVTMQIVQSPWNAFGTGGSQVVTLAQLSNGIESVARRQFGSAWRDVAS